MHSSVPFWDPTWYRRTIVPPPWGLMRMRWAHKCKWAGCAPYHQQASGGLFPFPGAFAVTVFRARVWPANIRPAWQGGCTGGQTLFFPQCWLVCDRKQCILNRLKSVIYITEKKETKTLSSLKVQMKDQISIYNRYSFILKIFIKHLPHAKDLAMNNTDLAPFFHRARQRILRNLPFN